MTMQINGTKQQLSETETETGIFPRNTRRDGVYRIYDSVCNKRLHRLETGKKNQKNKTRFTWKWFIKWCVCVSVHVQLCHNFY